MPCCRARLLRAGVRIREQRADVRRIEASFVFRADDAQQGLFGDGLDPRRRACGGAALRRRAFRLRENGVRRRGEEQTEYQRQR